MGETGLGKALLFLRRTGHFFIICVLRPRCCLKLAPHSGHSRGSRRLWHPDLECRVRAFSRRVIKGQCGQRKALPSPWITTICTRPSSTSASACSLSCLLRALSSDSDSGNGGNGAVSADRVALSVLGVSSGIRGFLGGSETSFSRMGSSATKPGVPTLSKLDSSGSSSPSGLSIPSGPGGSRGLNSTGAVSVSSSRGGGSATGSRSTLRASKCSVQPPSSTSPGLGLPTRLSPWGASIPPCLLVLTSSLVSGRAWSTLESATIPPSGSCLSGWADSWLEGPKSDGGARHCLAPSTSWLALQNCQTWSPGM